MIIVWIQMSEGGKMIGFKFVIPSNFPGQPAMPFLDEPINQTVSEIFDYVDEGNKLSFSYLDEWRKCYN